MPRPERRWAIIEVMKYVVCVPDGCADEPVAELGGRTPLEAADLPNLRALAARGEVGRAAVIPDGFPPGSDVGNMSIFGYDPARYHTGRAPIEAAALGLKLESDQVAYRCNLVTIGDDGTMVDFAGGHPSTEEAAAVVESLQAELGGDGVSFHPGVQYRHIVVAPKDWVEAECTPPHDLTGQAAVWPTGPAAPSLQRLMDASRAIVGPSPIGANQIWLWGQGFQPQMPSFAETYGLDAALVTAVDLVRGLGVLTDVRAVDLPTATGWYDTDYEGKRDCALEALAGGADLFILHVEASDEAGHAGDVEEKVKALENWDRRILADLVPGLDAMGPWRLLLLPDHATPLATRTHTSEPVPYLLVDSAVDGAGGTYSESGVEGLEPVPGHELMARLIRS
ncbi:cofactor-independent phosphoglycerate mutase [Rhabdothermincola salaria]|uniref:cofactor-independent phosphoglycerate mutase n=1 Tax=Rhabdothermincola salaria TaxID=2903142 RepID=UPI001E36770A|nr:cofactor-independent phosphoglycerate mutase [Rhabdothermincola salaria]MCD9625068.1 cofactor-independent phosphoglycerate mutase [Rhabdothermincola salaria]